jgi:hypothetical protein
MQRQKFFNAAAGGAAALVLATQTSALPALAATSQLDSDSDVYRVRGRLEGIITQVSGLAGDYRGHRGTALSALNTAKSDLDAAISVRGMNDALSDSIMTIALNETTEMINRLTVDTANYNGKKEAAIVQLNAAKAALQAAMKTA